ncbi:PRAME family member 12-like [Dasypus novemcinctus]|uniref:PRAME family member 12-like n=1 Tax=Dasypus novemcinctus TaxID=9361 RepID=UPI000C8289E4|nr:uncharacterized protein LOC111766053 [Dasypus novemcinctus]XP_023446894.1 uncharacterized protein LOC111766053 [Dasypus novemcinctus]
MRRRDPLSLLDLAVWSLLSDDEAASSKLKVLDFTHDHVFSDWEDCCLSQSAHVLMTQTLGDPKADQHTPGLRKEPPHDGEPVQMHADLHFNYFDFIHLPGCSLYLLQRAERSRGHFHLHCRVLEIGEVSLSMLVEIPRRLKLGSIRMLRLAPSFEVSTKSDLAPFFSQVGQMRDLNILMMWGPDWEFPADCFSLLSPLGHLKKVYLKFSNISDQLSKIVRSLQKPLETLVLNGCELTRMISPTWPKVSMPPA